MRKSKQQLPLDLGNRTAMGRDDFLISPSNQEAVSWIDSWPDWPAPCLILYGSVASGKTHLSSVWSEKSHAACAPMRDLQNASADDLANIADHLILDGVDIWFGDREAETTLFHLYNIFKEQKRTMLLTTHVPPNRLDFAVKDLASRLRAAPAVAIHPPDDTLLSMIIVKLFHDRQVQIGQDVLNYILPRIERSFASALWLVQQADRKALSEKRPVSIPLIREILLESEQVESEQGSEGVPSNSTMLAAE